MKVRFDSRLKTCDSEYYEISKKLIEKKHPLLKEYIEFKIKRYKNILKYIEDETESAKMRVKEVSDNIYKLEELLKCL